MSSHKILLKNKLKFLLRKYRALLKAKVLREKHGFSNYSVVAACYNVEKYLDGFVSSIVSQRLSFEDNIELILVDDGSTDATPEILKKWQQRYPDNIKVITKKNGGQASARNLGMQYATHEWLNFTDADDFLAYDAFYLLDRELQRQSQSGQDIKVVSFRKILFYDRDFSFKEIMQRTFGGGPQVFKIADLDSRHYMLTANSTLLRRDVVVQDKAVFFEKCRPLFEDATFVNTVLMHEQEHKILFYGDPVYYYRIRGDWSSSCNTAWSKRGSYTDVFEHGVFPILNAAQALHGHIPNYIQYAALAQACSCFPPLLNHDEVTDFLSFEDREKFLENLRLVYQSCDREGVTGFTDYPEDRDPFIYVVGSLGRFRDERPPYQRLYVADYDSYHDEVKVYYYSYFEPEIESFRVGDAEIQPVTRKWADMVFVGKKFLSVHTLWLSLKGLADDEQLSAHIDIPDTRISLHGTLTAGIAIGGIRMSFRREFVDESSPYAHAWLMYEQGTSDVAVTLYRHIKQSHPEICVCLVADKHSANWQSLKHEGIALIGHHGKEHKKALRNCDNVIITQRDDFTLNYYWGNKPGRNKPQLVIVQSPDNQDDLLSWIDTVNIDLFIGGKEHTPENIAAKFTAKEYRSIEWKKGLSAGGSSDERSVPDCEAIVQFTRQLRA